MKTRNKLLLLILCLVILCAMILSFLIIYFAQSQLHQFEMIPIDGRIVILNESGMPIPLQPTSVTLFSHYAPAVDRPWNKHQANFQVDTSGRFSGEMPKFPVTLFAHTGDGKYATVVHVKPEPSLTGLTVELRPRYSATGRLVDSDTNEPLADREFSFECEQWSDWSISVSFGGQKYAINEIFHSEKHKTDSTGLFTVDSLIPGAEYTISITKDRPVAGSNPYPLYRVCPLKMPFLSEKEYVQPYSFGDIPTPKPSDSRPYR